MSWLSQIINNPLPVLGGLISGGPAGALGAAAAQIGVQSISPPRPSLPAPPSAGGGIFSGMNQQANIWLQNQGIAPAAGSCPRGYHLNKHALAASRRHGAVPARSICVRNRSMNPLNHRALAKALRREKRARKLLGKLHVFKGHRSIARSSGHRAGCGCVVCKRR